MQTVKLEFRAGKMLVENNKVRPDLRQGKIQITIDDSEISHFRWLTLDDTDIEDFIIFPGEFKFSKVVQSSSRVYLLEFGDDRFFFWLQEPDKSKDAELCEKVNRIIGNPQVVEEKKIDTSGLAKMLESFAAAQVPELDEILNSEVLKGMTDDLKKYKDLIDLLPEEQKSAEFLRENLISPQLQQAMQVLSGAIRSPGGPAIFSSLGIQGYDDGKGDPLERLLKAIQAKSDIRKNKK